MHVRAPVGGASRIRSTRSTSPAPRCRRAFSPSRPRTWTDRNSTCGCWSTTANGWSAIASSSTTFLLWHLHDLWPELWLPGGALFSKKWSTRIGRRLARAQQTIRCRIAADELPRLRELTQAINQLEREISAFVGQIAPQLLSEPGFG